ncbi:MAG: hypothetical protein ACREHD_30960, partial [Pirellulales bacterium]
MLAPQVEDSRQCATIGIFVCPLSGSLLHLDKLAGFMSGTPIRSVVFLEAAALMKLVNDST